MRENMLNRALQEAQSDAIPVGSYSSFLVCDSLQHPTYGYLVNYSYIRCPQFAVLADGEEVLLFVSDGIKFAIQGSNIFHLARMMNLRRLSELSENQTIRFNSAEIHITSIIATPLGEED